MKRIKLFPVFMSILLILSGCSAKKEKLYQGTMTIPENGIVEKAVFEQIKNDSGVVTFTGNSNGCDYEWVIFGDAVPEPKDIDLSVEINEENEKKAVTISFNSQEDIGFSPMLSIHLNTVWNCSQATVYDENGEIVCRAYITEKENSIINFSVSKITGKYTVRSEYEKNTGISASTVLKTQSSKTTAVSPEIIKTESSVSDTFKEAVSAIKNNAVTANDTHTKDNVSSDSTAYKKEKYKTETVPSSDTISAKPAEAETDSKKIHTCTFLIECSAIFSNLSKLSTGKLDVLPENGVILPVCEVEFQENESVYDVLQRVCRDNNIHLESSWTPVYNSAYIEGIGNLYEFDCGELSGWMYRVNGWYPNYGCSRYQLTDGDIVEWRYTCDMGSDVGGGSAVDKT